MVEGGGGLGRVIGHGFLDGRAEVLAVVVVECRAAQSR